MALLAPMNWGLKMWTRSGQYLQRAEYHAGRAALYQNNGLGQPLLSFHRAESLEGRRLSWPDYLVKHRAMVARYEKLIEHHSSLRAKYERAARFPFLPVAPDPPEPPKPW
jgi:hypothetical protein